MSKETDYFTISVIIKDDKIMFGPYRMKNDPRIIEVALYMHNYLYHGVRTKEDV